MLEIEEVINWLREGDENKAADLLKQCEFSYEFIDIAFPIECGQDFEIFSLRIHTPRKILKQIQKHKLEKEKIEEAINELDQAESSYHFQNIHWVPRKNNLSRSPHDHEIEDILNNMDVRYIKTAWDKALHRRNDDPEGALTSAKTLIETVCKYILAILNIDLTGNEDINKLYMLTSKTLDISPSNKVNNEFKKVFGNINSLVGSIAFLRNKLGDAHGKSENNEPLIDIIGELSVNLAGGICTFLFKALEKKTEADR